MAGILFFGKGVNLVQSDKGVTSTLEGRDWHIFHFLFIFSCLPIPMPTHMTWCLMQRSVIWQRTKAKQRLEIGISGFSAFAYGISSSCLAAVETVSEFLIMQGDEPLVFCSTLWGKLPSHLFKGGMCYIFWLIYFHLNQVATFRLSAS